MKAYKVFNPDWTCLGFQYKVGETYEILEKPLMCERGFHACKNLMDCFSYYMFDPNNKVAEVELLGEVLGDNNDKQCTNKIKVVKELSWEEVLRMVNTGNGNTGHSNSGHRNSGYRNSGHWNSGHWNSGDWNSGHSNSGHRNSGHWNSGDCNSGHSNSGDCNSGDCNSGFFNSITPDEILVFNKPCKRSEWDKAKKPSFIQFRLTEWVTWDNMTEDEKKKNKDAHTTQGYLKVYGYKEAWKKAYDSAFKEDIELLKALPNFDADVFEEISGIRV